MSFDYFAVWHRAPELTPDKTFKFTRVQVSEGAQKRAYN